jgi:hypothetical protein
MHFKAAVNSLRDPEVSEAVARIMQTVDSGQGLNRKYVRQFDDPISGIMWIADLLASLFDAGDLGGIGQEDDDDDGGDYDLNRDDHDSLRSSRNCIPCNRMSHSRGGASRTFCICAWVKCPICAACPPQKDCPKTKCPPCLGREEEIGPVDPEKLRLDYNATKGLDNSDLVPVDDIERKSLPCSNQDDASCKYRPVAGRAPLNKIASGRSTAYVVNGEDATEGEWPSFAIVYVMYGSYTSEHYKVTKCGGTLVSDRHVITAAHCVHSDSGQLKPAEEIKVRVGKFRPTIFEEHEQRIYAKRVCAASKYNKRGNGPHMHDDWALIELEHPVEFNDYVQPAALPFEPVKTNGTASRCYLVGVGSLGRQGTGEMQYPDTLQRMRVDRVSCRAWGLSDRDRSRVCYSKHNRQEGDSCKGDSGGPVLCLNEKRRWTLVASVSFGAPYCDGSESWVGVYARIRTLLGDIKKECEF